MLRGIVLLLAVPVTAWSVARPPSLLAEATQAEGETDTAPCATLSPIAALFCRQDLPVARNNIAQEAHDAHSKCGPRQTRKYPSVNYSEFVANNETNLDLVWSAFSAFKPLNTSMLEKDMGEYVSTYPDAPISVADWSESYQPVVLNDVRSMLQTQAATRGSSSALAPSPGKASSGTHRGGSMRADLLTRLPQGSGPLRTAFSLPTRS